MINELMNIKLAKKRAYANTELYAASSNGELIIFDDLPLTSKVEALAFNAWLAVDTHQKNLSQNREGNELEIIREELSFFDDLYHMVALILEDSEVLEDCLNLIEQVVELKGGAHD